MDELDRLVAEDTQIKALRAARAILGGSKVEAAAAEAGIDARTLRKWRASVWWPQIMMAVEAEYREHALGQALRRISEVVADPTHADSYDAAKFLARLFLIDLPKVGGGRMAGGSAPAMPTATVQAAANMDPKQALLALTQMEKAQNE